MEEEEEAEAAEVVEIAEAGEVGGESRLELKIGQRSTFFLSIGSNIYNRTAPLYDWGSP